jgi:hypothetical protein
MILQMIKKMTHLTKNLRPYGYMYCKLEDRHWKLKLTILRFQMSNPINTKNSIRRGYNAPGFITFDDKITAMFNIHFL